jgi:hypothetical protein
MKDPKDTNPTGGKGKGKGGRNTFIDEIVSKSESAAQRPNLQKQIPSLHFEQFLEQRKKFRVQRQFRSQ